MGERILGVGTTQRPCEEAANGGRHFLAGPEHRKNCAPHYNEVKKIILKIREYALPEILAVPSSAITKRAVENSLAGLVLTPAMLYWYFQGFREMRTSKVDLGLGTIGFVLSLIITLRLAHSSFLPIESTKNAKTVPLACFPPDTAKWDGFSTDSPLIAATDSLR